MRDNCPPGDYNYIIPFDNNASNISVIFNLLEYVVKLIRKETQKADAYIPSFFSCFLGLCKKSHLYIVI